MADGKVGWIESWYCRGHQTPNGSGIAVIWPDAKPSTVIGDLFIYLFIQHLLARPKTANKHERSGDSQPRQAKREKKKDAVREGKEIGREKEREAH